MRSTNYSTIDQKCYKIEKLPNNCLHWVLDNYDVDYSIRYDFHIKHYCNDIHFNNARKPDIDIMIGDPWDLITEEEKKYIIKNKPKITYPVIRDENYVVTEFIKNMSFEKAIEGFLYYVKSNCWQVFYKDPNTNYPTKIFFDTRKIENMNDNDYMIHKNFNIIERTKMMENPKKYLEESMIHNYITCVILGGYNTTDVYFYPDIIKGTFDVIINKYH